MGKNILVTNEQFNLLLEEMNVGKEILWGRNNRMNLFSISGEERENPLLEAYFASYPFEMVVSHLEKRYHNKIEARIEVESNGEKVLYVSFDDLEENQKQIDKDLSLCGYFPSERTVEDGKRIVCYEKRHQKSIKEIVQEKGKIYHFTRRSVLGKIMKNGLCPRSGDMKFDYPERIYFFMDPLSLSDSKYFVRQLARTCEDKTLDYVQLEINTTGLGIDFFYDPDQFNAVYTKENVPPSRISVFCDKIYNSDAVLKKNN